jgi:hypothetical protein
VSVGSFAIGTNVAAAPDGERTDPQVLGNNAELQPGHHRIGRGDACRTATSHDGNPVLTWCIGNVVGKVADAATCIRPSFDRIKKIDAAAALMVALAARMGG